MTGHQGLGIQVEATIQCQACTHKVPLLMPKCPECGHQTFTVDTNTGDPKTVKGAIRQHDNRGILQADTEGDA